MSLRSVGKIKDVTTITVCDPITRKPLKTVGGAEDMTVTLHGPFSDRYKAVMREQQQRRATDPGAGASPTLTRDEIDEYYRELLFKCIDCWTVTLEGDVIVPLDREAVDAVFVEFPWLRDDIDMALGSRGNFLERPKPH